MRTRQRYPQALAGAGLLLASCIPLVLAQEKPPAPVQLVTFRGTATNPDGKPRTGVAGVTFALYQEEQGGAPLWMETQNVTLDATGGYTAQIGATQPEGLPISLFAAGQARWLEVQMDGQPAAQRVLLVSVPYALKAMDSQTLGGLPASAFALAAPAVNAAEGAGIASSRVATPAGVAKSTATPAASITGTGTAGYIPQWTGSATLGNSAIAQKSGDVGIGDIESGYKFTVVGSSGSGIFAETQTDTGIAVEGAATATSGNTFGVFGTSASTSGYGVEGSNSATTGTGIGVFGTTASTGGLGVQGAAQATSGSTFGVDGINSSTSGIGVQGHANASSGNTVGVNGISDSDSGTAVGGQATATSGSTFGVYGLNASAQGVGVEGYATATTGSTVGVSGQSDSSAGYGLSGSATATSGNTIGVVGQTASTSGYGVEGFATATSGNTFGVFGTSASPTGYGVEGSNSATTGTAMGVIGSTASTGGTAVKGQAQATSGSTYGVYGTNASSTGIGVQGKVSATSGINYGVAGTSASTQGVGVYGYGPAQSTLGGQLAGNAAGVWGDTHDGSAGVFATADSAEAIAAYNNASNVATLFVENQEDVSDTSIVMATYSDYGGYCDIFVNGNLSCSGSVGGHAVIPDGSGGSRDVAMYSVQAPENWFEDAGSGQLHGGAAVVTLDAAYSSAVNAGMEYHVFLTPKGDCKGLYVTNETAGSFEVHELGGGGSSIAFDYRIMARRKGFENIRMADLTGKIQKGPDLKSRNGARPERPAPAATSPDAVPVATARPVAPVAKRPAVAASPGR
ncbi:MAG: hypothetical protein ABSH50_03210 [Bryobacteraceae bacterium]|jgi:hypothetical protein